MSDAISRFDAQKLVYDYCHARTVEGRQLKSPAVFTTHTGTDLAEAIGALPALPALPAAQPDAREAALREALASINAKWRSGADTPDEMRGLALAEAAILDLIDNPGHVNETPKSEHDAANMLTPATKGGHP